MMIISWGKGLRDAEFLSLRPIFWREEGRKTGRSPISLFVNPIMQILEDDRELNTHTLQ